MTEQFLDDAFTRPARPVSDEDGPRYFCLDCHDEANAWRPFWCPGIGATRSMYRPDRSAGSIVECGRRKAHHPHQYVARCSCAETNPVIAGRRQREATARAAKKGRAA